MSGFKLKLKVPGTDGVPRAPSVTSGTPATPAPTSAVTPGGSKAPKLKFKTSNSQPPTPAPALTPAPVEDVKPKKTKAGRATKPSAKLIESKKRVKEESDSENEGSTIAVVPPPAKKIKLLKFNHANAQATGPKTPVVLKAKVKGKPPKRPPGEGYDSEASDREEDPYIEEEFVLRMVPGEDCDYLRTAIMDKKIGLPKNQGGPDISMKFFHQEGRRAAITIRGHCYAATLVDLPCVIEGMKSWDRRGWWKSADICQMLWVFSPIKKEDDAKTIALPKIIDETTFQYPHGLTPPMHFARKLRFRKRISRTAIEAVEEAVEKLLAEDAKAASTKYEMIDPDRQGSRAFSPGDSEGGYEEYSEDEDAEGEADDIGYFNATHTHAPPVPFDEDIDADLEADLEAAMQEESLAAETPTSAVGGTPSMLNGGETPMIEEALEEEEEDDSGDESLEDDDGDDENVVTVEADENEKARLAHIQSVKEDMADMEKQIEEGNRKLATTPNPILRRRLEENIRRMKAELQLKISSLGEGEGED